MATTLPLKSILKQPSSSQEVDPEPSRQQAQAEKDQKNLALALSHANRIALQKRCQDQILTNIETLLDFPNPPSPSNTDKILFPQLLTPFQPSDFTSLVEERRIIDRCGYALCVNQPRVSVHGESVKWKLQGGDKGTGDFCSTRCVRKAMLVKAQLSHCPVWERGEVEREGARVVLPAEDRVFGVGGEKPEPEGEEKGGTVQVGGREELAAERGEEPTSFRPQQVMMESIVEKKPSSQKSAATAPAVSREVSHRPGVVEGYEPASYARRGKDGDSDDEGEGEEATGFSSEIVDPYEQDAGGEIDPEEEAAWREMQVALRSLRTGDER